MKTKQEIDNEIAALTACKTYVPELTFFGDNNHSQLDAQIETLENGWDSDEARDHFEDYGASDRTIEGACAAAEWREGHSDESPSQGWDNFKPKA